MWCLMFNYFLVGYTSGMKYILCAFLLFGCKTPVPTRTNTSFPAVRKSFPQPNSASTAGARQMQDRLVKDGAPAEQTNKLDVPK